MSFSKPYTGLVESIDAGTIHVQRTYSISSKAIEAQKRFVDVLTHRYPIKLEPSPGIRQLRETDSISSRQSSVGQHEHMAPVLPSERLE